MERVHVQRIAQSTLYPLGAQNRHVPQPAAVVKRGTVDPRRALGYLDGEEALALPEQGVGHDPDGARDPGVRDPRAAERAMAHALHPVGDVHRLQRRPAEREAPHPPKRGGQAGRDVVQRAAVVERAVANLHEALGKLHGSQLGAEVESLLLDPGHRRVDARARDVSRDDVPPLAGVDERLGWHCLVMRSEIFLCHGASAVSMA